MRLALGFAAGLSLLSAMGAGAADRAREALDGNDPFAIEEALKDPHLKPAQAAILNGAAAAMRFEDEAAIDALSRGLALNGVDPELRRQALSLLGGVHLRAGHYAAAARAFDAAMSTTGASQSADERHSMSQARAVAFALRNEAPQTHEPPREGSVAITRDAAGLPRATGQVNGAAQEFILDTGAGYSTVTRSAAQRLKLRPLSVDITVGSSTAKSVPAQLGIADQVEIAGNRFRNVVFLVLADEALSFSGGAYKIDAILGFPVLSRLGRIEFARAGGAETFRVVRPAPRQPGAVRDLYLDMLRPMAVAEFAGAGRVRLLLDTGAKRSSLNARFAAAFPAVMQNATSEKATFGGAGAMQTIDVKVLRNVSIAFDGAARRLDKITVSPETKDEHGALGQDVLEVDGGFALDFVAMDFTFLPAR